MDGGAGWARLDEEAGEGMSERTRQNGETRATFGQRRRVRGVVVREDAVGARDLCLGDGEGSGEHRHD